MTITFSDVCFGFLLSLLAGLATGAGAAVAFFMKKTDTKLLTFALGSSAGVMVYISFVELLQTARGTLMDVRGESAGGWCASAAFFGGILLAALIDKLVPEDENPHEVPALPCRLPEERAAETRSPGVRRSGMLFALAIAIHNFPEGIATLASALSSEALGVSVAAAVAVHNIPEGIAVAVPLYYGTGSRRKAFLLSFLSGLAEPLGAGLAALLLMPFITPALIAVLFALVAGIMVYISFDELLPMAERWGHHHLSIYGVVLGMLLMAVILAL